MMFVGFIPKGQQPTALTISSSRVTTAGPCMPMNHNETYDFGSSPSQNSIPQSSLYHIVYITPTPS